MGLLRNGGYWRWSAGVQLMRLPNAMAPLAFTMLTTATTGSYRLGGVMMSVFVVAELAGAIPGGRLLDRIGVPRGLVLMLVIAGAGFGAVALFAAYGSPAATLVAVVIPGAAAGGLSGGFRALLAGTVDAADLPRAISIDVMILESVLIAGPAFVAVLGGPFWPLVVMALACVLSAVFVPRRQVAPKHSERSDVPLKACLPWLACMFTVGLLLATIELATLPLVQRLGAPDGMSALVMAVLCGASIAGNAGYAWRGTTGDARLFLAGFMAGGTIVAANLGWTGLVAGIILVGLCTGPLATVASVNLQALLPESRRSEGFSVAFTVQAAGFGLGSLAVGVLPLWLPPLFGVVAAAATCGMLAVRARRAVVGTVSVTS
ncbi:MFS transporter [Amycolatopsis sp. NPDC059657]|uniref:MFS transporter n=1 Tax=Amycolatopsis sp. NPDC059657 TaxID=3346899 RepID=UPI00366A587F